tara:strand:+ start:8035 stop:8976 length:942 start_codon:yes stop_codon:yes gene_type:complete
LVNASLNWASIVGIVLAVCGAGLYFLRSFKPALARDYDVFFAAIGLLCGGILFFQGWRLDPILQFGQFLLAGTTVFFAYESVRLRGLATDQARRSSYFEDEEMPSRIPSRPRREGWDDSYEQFEEPQLLRRRFSGSSPSSQDPDREDYYSPEPVSRAAIPERAASRNLRKREFSEDWRRESSNRNRRMERFGSQESDMKSSFGERRNERRDSRRGTRPIASNVNTSRTRTSSLDDRPGSQIKDINPTGTPKGSPIRPQPEDAAFSQDPNKSSRPRGSSRRVQDNQNSSYKLNPKSNMKRRRSGTRDNSSRFDD